MVREISVDDNHNALKSKVDKNSGCLAQRGSGLGGVLGLVKKYLLPVVKSYVLPEVKHVVLKTISDVSSGENFKTSVKRNAKKFFKRAGTNFVQDQFQPKKLKLAKKKEKQSRHFIILRFVKQLNRFKYKLKSLK